MFAVIYSFKIHPEKEKQFLHAWHELTRLIYLHEQSYGSRLLQEGTNRYIAYAQWPDKRTWKNAGSKLPMSADPFRSQMRERCMEIKTLYELDMIDDQLAQTQFNNNDIPT